MTAPTEAEIRAYMEAYPAPTLEVGDLGDYPDETFAFEEFIDSEFTHAHHEALLALMPAITAALRPFMIEARMLAAVRFFEHYPDAPRAKEAVHA